MFHYVGDLPESYISYLHLPEDKKGYFWKLAQIILKDVSNYFTRRFIHQEMSHDSHCLILSCGENSIY